MASIIDSFRETFSDRWSFLKIAAFALPSYFVYQMYLQSNNNFGSVFWYAFTIIFFLFGFLIETTHNVISEQDIVLATLNPLKLAFVAIKGILAIGLFAWISCFAANYVCSMINLIPWLDTTLKTVIWFLAAAIILTAFLMFSARERILDVFKMRLLSEKAGDLILVILFFALQIIIINIPTTLFIGYAIFVLFGQGMFLGLFVAFALIFNIAVAGHYFGQVHYENIEYTKETKL